MKPQLFELSEHEIMHQIIDDLRIRGAYVQRINSGQVPSFYDKKDKEGNTVETRKYMVKLADYGTPDILGVIKGKFFGIEVKKNQKKAVAWHKQKTIGDKMQKQHLLHIQEQGGHAFLVYSYEDYIQQFKSENMFI